MKIYALHDIRSEYIMTDTLFFFFFFSFTFSWCERFMNDKSFIYGLQLRQLKMFPIKSSEI